MKHRGIIFDMDGTLWDSAENVAKSWNKAIAEYGYEREPVTKEDMYSVMGKTMDVLASIIFPNCACRDELIKVCYKEENDYLRTHGGQLYPQVEETLQTLSKTYDLYIVSNCQSGYIEAFFEYHGLGKYFKDIECYGNNALEKSENIKLIVERNHIDEAVYVGDIQGDYDSSKKAGVKFIHAAYGFGTIDEDVVAIKQFADLSEVAGKVFCNSGDMF